MATRVIRYLILFQVFLNIKWPHTSYDIYYKNFGNKIEFWDYYIF